MYAKFRKFRTAAVALCAVPALALSACGSSVPGNSVVKVGDQSIKKATFDHWMKIAAVSQAGASGATATSTPTVPDSPNFTTCVATKRKSAAKPAKGQPEQTDAQLKAACQQEYSTLKNQVLEFLIRSTWLDNEAGKQNVKVADSEVKKQIDQAKKQAFQKPGDFEKFLQRSGLTEADVFFQQRGQLLEQKLTQKVTKGKNAVTDQQISQYYEKNKAKFAQPERRDLRLVLTKDQARAQQAKQALDGGQSWSAVAKKYSIDQASKSQGGKLAGVAKGQQEKALDSAIFQAPKGKMVGPIKTQFGWYVLEVTKVTAGKQQSLEQSKASIKQILASENQRKALDTFGKDYRKRWKDQTQCRKGFETQDCKNGPKATTATTGATTAPPTATQP
ncbi:MAG: foldase protein PrsA [Solirubrobacteraceae bacterium]|jgi:foldase protein PrsA|nr:foldase protein PrsA [Solirubrobacteraceae bacterium]